MSDWLFLCGILSGVTTWLFGFGGGFVTVPQRYFLVTGAWGAQSVVGQQAIHIAVATGAGHALLRCWRAGDTRVPVPSAGALMGHAHRHCR
ncbi:MAG: hypothetical protein ACLR17_03940 [Enterobacteriaceae bacterium]